MFNKLGKMGSVFSVLMFLAAFVSNPGYCALTAAIGDQNSSGNYRVEVDTDGVVTFANDTGIKFPYNSGTTDETLEAADSGRTYVTTTGTVNTVQITLPAAAVGMVYPFIAGTTLDTIFTVPTGTIGTTFARFRVTSVTGTSPTGPATDGEVEDYQLTITPVPLDYGDAPDTGLGTGTGNYEIHRDRSVHFDVTDALRWLIAVVAIPLRNADVLHELSQGNDQYRDSDGQRKEPRGEGPLPGGHDSAGNEDDEEQVEQ